MVKTCRKYWNREIADSIVQLKRIRFHNPQFSLETTFDTADFTRLLVEHFGIARSTVDSFFAEVRAMDFFDDQRETTRQLFDRYFPGRSDVVRFLIEPIAYANGSTLDEPAITYGIVFSNFMDKGVYTFQGGTDRLIRAMRAELEKNGVTIQLRSRAEKILLEGGKIKGVLVQGQEIPCRCVVSNANLKRTALELVGRECLPPSVVEEAEALRLSTSSCQVYLGIRAGETIEDVGDLLFTSSHPVFDSDELSSRQTTSRTFSFYYPKTRPGHDRYAIVASMNARYEDWARMDAPTYAEAKKAMIESTLDALEAFLPGIREKIDWKEAATPLTFERYTGHLHGASFGSKFEALSFTTYLTQAVPGLFHAGSAAIIMSGWLGAMNYGVIVANQAESYLESTSSP